MCDKRAPTMHEFTTPTASLIAALLDVKFHSLYIIGQHFDMCELNVFGNLEKQSLKGDTKFCHGRVALLFTRNAHVRDLCIIFLLT